MKTSLNIFSNKTLKIIGSLLIALGIILLFLIYFPLLKQEIIYQGQQVFKNKNQQETSKEIIPVDNNFGLVIPKIEVNAKVFANVDAQNPKEYLPILVKGVAQAKGSFLPGQEGNVFIFAHSSDNVFNAARYNAVFYLLNKMEKDDEIFIYYQQQKFSYQVLEKKILNPEKMSGFLKTLKGKTLVLQTCYPPGTTLKRLLLIAKEII